VLAASFVLPFVGYLIGAGLALASMAWDGHDKAIALRVPPFILVVGGLIVLPVEASVTATVLIASAPCGLLSAAYLAYRLRRPRAA
jgi:hypothetical protein